MKQSDHCCIWCSHSSARTKNKIKHSYINVSQTERHICTRLTRKNHIKCVSTQIVYISLIMRIQPDSFKRCLSHYVVRLTVPLARNHTTQSERQHCNLLNAHFQRNINNLCRYKLCRFFWLHVCASRFVTTHGVSLSMYECFILFYVREQE